MLLSTIGKEKYAVLKELEVYHEASNRYAFNFNGLLAAELRVVMRTTVYEEETQISETMTYSIDAYGNSRTDTILTLVQVMITYSDSAKSFFS